MNFVSVCSGIEAASVAWTPLGWKCLAVAEIDKFPCRVLKHHYPEVPNVGDFTKIRGDEFGQVDVLVGGTPCQDFSVAGLRAGMDGKRGQLTIEFARLAHRLATEARARWICWENVPGVLSSDDGRAFAIFLGLLSGRSIRVPADGWRNSGIVPSSPGHFGLCWRILDAQHFGVPQRRRRVFVVGYLGDWRRAAAVLFERHSLSGDTPPSREKGKVAPTIPARSTGGGGLGSDFDFDGGLVYAPLTRNPYADNESREANLVPVCMATGQGSAEIGIGIGIGTTLNCNHEAPIVTHALRGEGFDASEDGTGRGTPLVPISIQAGCVRENPDSGPDGVGVREDGVAYTLEARAEVRLFGGDGQTVGALAADPGMKQQSYVAFTCKDHGADAGELAPTLRSMGHDGSHANGGGQVAVMTLALRGRDGAPNLEIREDGTSNAILTANGGRGGIGVGAVAIGLDEEQNAVVDGFGCLKASKEGGGFEGTVMTQTMAVRRLTPEECEKLQGFEPGYTKIDEKTADGPRYKALGNSFCVPAAKWIGERIQIVEEITRGTDEKTLTSCPVD